MTDLYVGNTSQKPHLSTNLDATFKDTNPLLKQPGLSAETLTPNEPLNLNPSDVLTADGKISNNATDFAGNLWDRSDALLELYTQRLSTLERLNVFFREKAALDEQYARSLEHLVDRAKLTSTEDPNSALTKSLAQFAQLHKALAQQQEVVSRRAATNFADRIRAFCGAEAAEFTAAKRRLDDARKAHDTSIVQMANSRAQAFSAAAMSIAERRKVRLAARRLAEYSGGLPNLSQAGADSVTSALQESGVSIEQFENLQRHASLSDTRARDADEAYQQEINAAIELRVAQDTAIADVNSMIQRKLAHRTVVAARALLGHTRLLKAQAQLSVDTIAAAAGQLLGATEAVLSENELTSSGQSTEIEHAPSVETAASTTISALRAAVVEELTSVVTQLETDAAPEPYPSYDVPPGHPDAMTQEGDEEEDKKAVAFAAESAARAHARAQELAHKYARGLSLANISFNSDIGDGLNAALGSLESAAKETAAVVQAAISNMFSSGSAASGTQASTSNSGSSVKSTEVKSALTSSKTRSTDGASSEQSSTSESLRDESDDVEQWSGSGSVDSEAHGENKPVARQYVEREIARIVEGALGCSGLLTLEKDETKATQDAVAISADQTPSLTDDDLQLAKSLFATNDGRNACAFVINKLRKHHNIQFSEAALSLLAKILHAFLDSAREAMHVRPAQLVMILSQTLYSLSATGEKKFLQVWIKDHAIWRSLRFWNEAFCDALTRQIMKQKELIQLRSARDDMETAQRTAAQQAEKPESQTGSFMSMFAPSYLMQTLGLAETEPPEVLARREKLRRDEAALEEAKQEAAFALLGTFASNMAEFDVPSQHIRAFANKMAINTGLRENHIAILQGLPMLRPQNTSSQQ